MILVFSGDWTEEHDNCHDRSNQSAYTVDPYAYGVYDTCYIRLSDATTSDGWGACFTDFTFAYYTAFDLTSLNIFDLSEEMYDILMDLDYSTEDPSSVTAYRVAADGGLIYNPISREKADELSKYDDAACYIGEVKTTVQSTPVIFKAEPKKQGNSLLWLTSAEMSRSSAGLPAR